MSAARSKSSVSHNSHVDPVVEGIMNEMERSVACMDGAPQEYCIRSSKAKDYANANETELHFRREGPLPAGSAVAHAFPGCVGCAQQSSRVVRDSS